MPSSASLPRSHLFLAVAVMAVWGSNFVVIKLALTHLPPLLLAALRFSFAFLPAAFFLKRPAVPWSNLAAYGVLIGAGQFGLLFLAMKGDITPGLASLVVQIQVFFTIGLSMRLTGERVRFFQWTALALATLGLGVIVIHSNGSATPLGLILVIAAAFCWSSGNLVARAAGKVDMLAYVVWASVFAVPPLFLFALIFEGWPAMVTGVERATATTWAAVVWQAVGNTMFGYGIWGWLLARHPAATVAPMALLVPVFGMGASALYLGEPLQDWKLLAAALVMGGLALSLLWPRFAAMRPASTIAEKMIKVDHAGENGAVNIYRGQRAVAHLIHPGLKAQLSEFQGHEQEHREIFRQYLAGHEIRRCVSYHACGAGGLVLGLITGLMGANAIAATTYAVESVVIQHLASQMAHLRVHDHTALDCVERIYADEKAHHDRAQLQMGEPDRLTRGLIAIVRFSTECVIRFGMR